MSDKENYVMTLKADDPLLYFVLDKAGVTEPFKRLKTSLEPVKIFQYQSNNLFKKNLYLIKNNGILITRKHVDSFLDGKIDKTLKHELAHHVFKSLGGSYLRSEEDDIVINSLDYLINRESKNILLSNLAKGSRETRLVFARALSDKIGIASIEGTSRHLVEGFANYVADLFFKNRIIFSAITGITVYNVLSFINHLINNFSLLFDAIYTSFIALNIYILGRDSVYIRNIYSKWVEEFNDSERLALLSFPPKKREKPENLLEELEKYSLVV